VFVFGPRSSGGGGSSNGGHSNGGDNSNGEGMEEDWRVDSDESLELFLDAAEDPAAVAAAAEGTEDAATAAELALSLALVDAVKVKETLFALD
jgi:hypothetical protein